MFCRILTLLCVTGMSFPFALAQSQPSQEQPVSQGDAMDSAMQMGGPATTLKDNVLRHTASGTSLEPDAVAPPMLMTMHGNWMLMLHGQAMIAEQQQTGPRGHDKLFSANWFMPMAQREIGRGQLTLRTMLSLEPATISGRYYPELFQQGETAFGKPIVDGQHPHNLFMEIAGIYDYHASDGLLLSIYAAPVGDPSLGPVAFPHRISASEDPLAPLGHHLEDSTHIAYEVVTAGATYGRVHWEASGFHGREPGENRWTIAVGGLDSWSTRLTVTPTRTFAMQYSVGHLHSPEALHPEEDVLRQTASIAYHHGWGSGDEASTLDGLLLWGRNHTIGTPTNANGYLLEATAQIRKRDSLWTRMENVDRTTDLLGAAAPAEETVVGRVQAYTAGYTHRIYRNGWSWYNLGAQTTFYDTPGTLRSLYGDHPVGVAVVLNIHLGR
ncbi:hypothetical protein ACFPT7_21180 [Acidicapsa dinghuensis]|uniref:Porin n=1 Tax=Acidicapsa dinghuensis TaxID=2218256 RepID=A0ABW1ELF9_9BACT|nr:hypothetical protein [Acidicapsa dinghuensis]